MLNYGRQTADRIIKQVRKASEKDKALLLQGRDLEILSDMLYEMDRHLPDFFEEEQTMATVEEAKEGGNTE